MHFICFLRCTTVFGATSPRFLVSGSIFCVYESASLNLPQSGTTAVGPHSFHAITLRSIASKHVYSVAFHVDDRLADHKRPYLSAGIALAVNGGKGEDAESSESEAEPGAVNFYFSDDSSAQATHKGGSIAGGGRHTGCMLSRGMDDRISVDDSDDSHEDAKSDAALSVEDSEGHEDGGTYADMVADAAE